MFKFLRKYNKFILAIGGTLLLIVFLIPQALTQLSKQAAAGSATWATVGTDNRSISSAEREQAQTELQFLKGLGIGDWIDTPEHWWLMVYEAEQMGMVPGIGTIPLDSIPIQSGYSPGLVRQAVAKFTGVQNLLGNYQTAGVFSDRRLRDAARRGLQEIGAEVMAIEASADRTDFQPTEDEIQAQFDRFADVVPGEGEMGFGYRLPDRFKLEILTISADSVERMIENSDRMNEVEQRKYWRRHEGQNGVGLMEAGAEVPEIVHTNMLQDLTSEMLNEIERFATRQLQTARRNLTSTDGYFTLPDDWNARQLSFPELAERIRDRSEFAGIELPTYQSIGDRWLAIEDIADLGDIANAGTDRLGTAFTRLADLVQAMKEFGGSTTIPVQARVALPPLRTDGRTIHLVRVTAVDPARAPHSLDEVRDRVVNDLKRKHDYEQLLTEVDSVEQLVEGSGMLAASIARGVPMTRTSISIYNQIFLQFEGMPLDPSPSPLPVVGTDEDVTREILAKTIDLPYGKALDELPPADRVFTFPVESHLAILVLRVTDVRPLSSDMFRTLMKGGRLRTLVQREESKGDDDEVLDVFGYDALAARHNFVVTSRRETEEESQESADDTESATASAATD